MKYLGITILIFILLFSFECSSNKSIEKIIENEKRLNVKKITNKNYSASLFDISDITDINTYVEVEDKNDKEIVYKGSYSSVVDIYFKGIDTLVLKRYQPSSGIEYVFKNRFNLLNIVQDSIVNEEEYYKLLKRNDIN